MGELVNRDEEVEIEKLARVISDELDIALIDNGLVPVSELMPFDTLPPAAQQAIREAAERVYQQMLYDTTSGILRVVRHRPGA